jgi:hypothetical protein
LTDCEAIDVKAAPATNVCLKCGNNKTPDSTGATCTTIPQCTTHVGNKNVKCLTCNANFVLIDTITLPTLQQGGKKCVDIASTTDTDLIAITSFYTTLPTDCIAYDSAS